MTEEEIRMWRHGAKFGLWQYAWWKDDIEYVGTCGTTLKQAQAAIDAGKYDVEMDITARTLKGRCAFGGE